MIERSAQRLRWSAYGLAWSAALVLLSSLPASARGQQSDTTIVRVDLPAGRSYVIQPAAAITRVAVANPDVADVVVMSRRDVVVNGRVAGETDVIVWEGETAHQHYRMLVHAPADQPQIVLSVKFAEVRRDLIRDLGVSGLGRLSSGKLNAGTGAFNNSAPSISPVNPLTIPNPADFGTVLTNFGTKQLLALIQAQEQKGDAHILAEPKVIAGNNDTASFLAGGELPIPIAQTSAAGLPIVTIVWKEFGIRLFFSPQVVSDTLIRLHIRPEFSQLDFTNAIVISGFSIPALRTRRVESTVDVRRDQSLILSGLLDDERLRARTGVPLLMHLPIIGALFSSQNWQRNETELLVIVTPVVVDPLHPRGQDILPLLPDTTLPARGAIERRLPQGAPPTAAPKSP
jgi:Flp pilus assembly secretin CpaC